MTRNHLIVSLQSWSIEECGILLHSHYFQVHSDPEWLYLLLSHSQIEIHNHFLTLKPFNCMQTNYLC